MKNTDPLIDNFNKDALMLACNQKVLPPSSRSSVLSQKKLPTPLEMAIQFKAEKNFQAALHLFEAITTQLIPDAYFHLGTMYLDGLWVSQNEEKAMEYFAQAIALNSSAGKGKWLDKYNLGYLAEMGYGRMQDYVLAKTCYQLAGINGNAMGYFRLGFMMERGLDECQIDLCGANLWYTEALAVNPGNLSMEDRIAIENKIAVNKQKLY